MPNSSTALSTSATRESSSVMSVGTTSARRPCERTTSAIFSSRRSVRLTSTRSAPIRAASSPSDRPRPGPTPDRTTTLSLQQRDGLVGVGDGRRVVGGGGGHGARLERVSVLVESGTGPLVRHPDRWPWTDATTDQGTRPLDTWDGLRGAGRANRRPVQRLLVHLVPPRGPRRPWRGRGQPRLQGADGRGGRRARRAGLRRRGRGRLGRVRHPDELPNIHHRKQYDAETVTPPDYRITCINVDEEPPQAGLGARRAPRRGRPDRRGRRRCRRGLPAGHGHARPGQEDERRRSSTTCTRKTYEEAGFTYVRPKGQHNCVMTLTVEPVS